jgi:sirohydrochlorin ferrochelatase
MVAEMVERLLFKVGLNARHTCLVIAAHGGKTSPNPARAARDFGTALGRASRISDIRCGFLEEAPYLEDVAVDAGTQAVCLPFFAGNGAHVRYDVEQALERAGFGGIVLEPVGISQKIPDLIAASLRRGFAREKAC